MYILYTVMGIDPFFLDTDPDPLLCDPFPYPDHPLVTRSFPDPYPLFLTRSRYGSDRRSMIAILPTLTILYTI